MPPRRPLVLQQTVIMERYPDITVQSVECRKVSETDVDGIANSLCAGVAAAFTTDGTLAMVAISNAQNALVVKCIGARQQSSGWEVLRSSIFQSPTITLFAFDGHGLALSLYQDMQLPVCSVVDIQSINLDEGSRDPIKLIKAGLGPDVEMYEDNIATVFRDSPLSGKNEDENSNTIDIVQRAWLSHLLAITEPFQTHLKTVPRINLMFWPDENQLDMYATTMKHSRSLEEEKFRKHQFAGYNYHNGQLSVSGSNYQTRLRQISNQTVSLNVTRKNGAKYTVSGTVKAVTGKSSTIVVSDIQEQDVIESIQVDNPLSKTQSEEQQSCYILQVLQGVINSKDNIWLQRLYSSKVNGTGEQSTSTNTLSWDLPVNDPWSSIPELSLSKSDDNVILDNHDDHDKWNTAEDPWSSVEVLNTTMSPIQDTSPAAVSTYISVHEQICNTLNNSQYSAVEAMLASKDITVVQGPPGTGKTTVITAFVLSILQNSTKTIWLTARSNVAVKNIALKLMQQSILSWKLLVSSEFYFDWHDHLYNDIPSENIITSSDFAKKRHTTTHCRVMLATLGTLCSKQVQYIGYLKNVPLQILVIDEASQVEASALIPVLNKYGKSLQKICFLGDNNQLPPYGSDKSKIRSLFDLEYVQENILLLNVQYRMPSSIGSFLSQSVYNGMLLNGTDEIAERQSCQFIDIADGKEMLDNKSFKNPAEASAVIEIAKYLTSNMKKFKILTLYNAQKTLIEVEMQKTGISSGNTCYTVDTFQGNEAEFIIISLVRTREVGFLHDQRRSNVMLSRCKRGMFICTQRAFLEGVASKTLVGKMSLNWKESWKTMDQFTLSSSTDN